MNKVRWQQQCHHYDIILTTQMENDSYSDINWSCSTIFSRHHCKTPQHQRIGYSTKLTRQYKLSCGDHCRQAIMSHHVTLTWPRGSPPANSDIALTWIKVLVQANTSGDPTPNMANQSINVDIISSQTVTQTGKSMEDTLTRRIIVILYTTVTAMLSVPLFLTDYCRSNLTAIFRM